MTLVFAAWEAGAAAWMAPVWRSLLRPSRIYLASAAMAALERCGALPSGAGSLDTAPDWPADAGVVVASASGRPEEVEALARASRLGFRVIQVIDTWDNYAARFPECVWPDRIAVIDAAAKAEAVEAGLPADRLIVLGHPGWETVPRLPQGDPMVALFVGQPIASRRGRSLGYDERDAWNVMLEACALGPRSFRRLIYLAHPEESEPMGDHVSRDPGAALAEAGTVVGMFSAFLVKAVLAGRRVSSLQPGLAVADPCGLSRHGRIPLATSMAALRDWLARETSVAQGLEQVVVGSVNRVRAAIEELTD